MIVSVFDITDNSTETFRESGDEDRNKTKSITITSAGQHRPALVAVHVDNSRDLGVRYKFGVYGHIDDYCTM